MEKNILIIGSLIVIGFAVYHTIYPNPPGQGYGFFGNETVDTQPPQDSRKAWEIANDRIRSADGTPTLDVWDDILVGVWLMELHFYDLPEPADTSEYSGGYRMIYYYPNRVRSRGNGALQTLQLEIENTQIVNVNAF